MKILKHKSRSLKSDYDFWGEQIYKYIDRDLKSWIKNEIKNNALLDYDILNKDEFIKYFEKKRLPLSSYGTFIVLSKFIKRIFNKSIILPLIIFIFLNKLHDLWQIFLLAFFYLLHLRIL